MRLLPMPIRVAAGLVATLIEEAEHLPRRLTELPVTAVSQALQHAMRVQQKVTDLAIKGDRALGALRPVPEAPTWARFDEDEEAPPIANGRNGLGGAPARRFEPFEDDGYYPPPQPPRVTPVRILPDLEPDDQADDLDEFDGGGAARFDEDEDDDDAAAEIPEQRVNLTGLDNRLEASAPAEPADPEPATAIGPAGFEGYEEWSLPQLRARFRSLKPHQLQLLLDWESAHQQRPPYVTMLSNRIASVTGR
jgi:hypothetical protein